MAKKPNKQSAPKVKANETKSKPTKPEQKAIQKKTLPTKTILLIVLGVVLLFAILLIVFSARNEWMLKKINFQYASVQQMESIYDISISEDEVKQRIKETNRHGKKVAFCYFCEENMTLLNGASYGSLILANPADNKCDLVVTIFDENGRLIYQSDGIAPGKYLSQISLMQYLEAGEHKCRVYVAGFDSKDNHPVGAQYTNLKIVVEENLDG